MCLRGLLRIGCIHRRHMPRLVAAFIWLQIFHFAPASNMQGVFRVPQECDDDTGEQDALTVPYASPPHNSMAPWTTQYGTSLLFYSSVYLLKGFTQSRFLQNMKVTSMLWLRRVTERCQGELKQDIVVFPGTWTPLPFFSSLNNVWD